MQPSSSPLVVLVHGAWHGAWCFAMLQAELDNRGIASLAVDLPGHGASTAPLGDLHGDAAEVAALLYAHAGSIVLVGHSYGGAVISQVAAPSNVTHLVYLAAFVLDVGESVIGLNGLMPPAETALAGAIRIEEGASTIDPDRAGAAFYGDCDPMVAAAATARLGRQPYATFTQEATNASWRTIPSTYVRCSRDASVALAQQDWMAARCTTVETIETDHSPFASRPVETAEIIARLLRTTSSHDGH